MVQRTQTNVICRRVNSKPPGGRPTGWKPVRGWYLGGYWFNCFGGRDFGEILLPKKSRGWELKEGFWRWRDGREQGAKICTNKMCTSLLKDIYIYIICKYHNIWIYNIISWGEGAKVWNSKHGSGWKMIFNVSVLEGDCSCSMFFFRRRVVFPTKKNTKFRCPHLLPHSFSRPKGLPPTSPFYLSWEFKGIPFSAITLGLTKGRW